MVAASLLFTFLAGMIGCDRASSQDNNEPRGVDVEVDVRPAPCDSTMYEEPPVTERREIDDSGNVRVKVTVRTCCCCCGYKDDRDNLGYVPPYPITGTGPGGGGPPATATPPTNPVPPVTVASVPSPSPVPGRSPVTTLPPYTAGFPGGVPAVVPAAPAGGGLPWWLAGLALPVLLLDSDDDGDFPPGIICGDDSGLPTGPNRPRC